MEGKDLFFFPLPVYESKPANLTPEAHRDYIDIQFLVEGTEKVGVAPLEDMLEEVEGRPDSDIWFYRGPVDEITLSGNRFAVFFPGDAHAPGIAGRKSPLPAASALSRFVCNITARGPCRISRHGPLFYLSPSPLPVPCENQGVRL